MFSSSCDVDGSAPFAVATAFIASSARWAASPSSMVASRPDSSTMEPPAASSMELNHTTTPSYCAACTPM